MSNRISRIIFFTCSLLMTSLTFKHGDFSQMSFPASQWGRHQIRDREFGWYILRYIFKSSSWVCSVGQHFPSDNIFLLKNIMNWKNNKKDMAKELIVTLPSAWPWAQGKVPNLPCHSTPSSSLHQALCSGWPYHFLLPSWQTDTILLSFLTQTRSQKRHKPPAGYWVSRWQIIIDVSARSVWGRLLMHYRSDARLSEGQRDETLLLYRIIDFGRMFPFEKYTRTVHSLALLSKKTCPLLLL